jgi:hypothetical protein
MFKGASLLREKEKPKEDAHISESAKQLQAYLAQQYGSGVDTEKQKRKKVKPKQPASGTVRIVDQDASGFAALSDKNSKKRGPQDEGDDEGDFQLFFAVMPIQPWSRRVSQFLKSKSSPRLCRGPAGCRQCRRGRAPATHRAARERDAQGRRGMGDCQGWWGCLPAQAAAGQPRRLAP